MTDAVALGGEATEEGTKTDNAPALTGDENAGQTPEQKAEADKAAADKKAADDAAKTPEQKAAEEKEAKDKAEADKKNAVPEKYEDFKVPEGLEADPAVLDEFKGLAKDLGLTQEKAQKLVDFQAGLVKNAFDAQTAAWAETVKTWQAEAKADPEIGGAKYDESVGLANKFLKAHGTPALFNALKATGTGNHGEFIRIFARAGRAIGEDKLVTGGSQSAGKSPANLLFPTMKE